MEWSYRFNRTADKTVSISFDHTAEYEGADVVTLPGTETIKLDDIVPHVKAVNRNAKPGTKAYDNILATGVPTDVMKNALDALNFEVV